MNNAFEEISKKENLFKVRIVLMAAFASSFVFWFFMVKVGPNHQDFPVARVGLAVIAFIGIVLSFHKSAQFQWLRWCFNVVTYGYVLLYLQFLHLHDWNVFHRWSYFVVISVIGSVALTWPDYLYFSLVALLGPFILGFFSDLSFLEQFHFHSACFVTLFVIGISIRANFRYREELTQLTKGLVQSSKMAALGEMAAGVAHEINNPLAIIVTGVENLKVLYKNGGDPEKAELFVGKVNSAVQRIARIVQGLLNFSRAEASGTKRVTDFREIVSEALDLCSEKFHSEGVKLIYQAPFSEINCKCEKFQILQILINLLNNAYDACRNSPNPEIRLELGLRKQFVEFSICDSGPGVPVEIENQIMQPFFTTKPIGKGTGLGLSISLGLARGHGGDLFLDRSVSTSCFKLRLPEADT